MLRIVLSAGILAFVFLFELVFDGIDVFIDIVFDLRGIFVFDIGDFLDVVGVFGRKLDFGQSGDEIVIQGG